MGVPGYFQWVSRRYPWVVKKIRPNAPKRHINCLYIDVNAICYEYTKDEVNFNYLLNPKSLQEIYKQIIEHLEVYIELMQPTHQIYLMLDGPCPRAKINQQRQRRFRGWVSNEELKAKLSSHGLEVKCETVPMNSISPGTYFMVELNKQIRSHFAARIATFEPNSVVVEPIEVAKTEEGSHTADHKHERVDYRKVQVIISDSSAPGEGEHKILEIIRKHTNHNLTHCLVGADADLILLTLSTPGKRIVILRENNKLRLQRDETFGTVLAAHKAKLAGLDEDEEEEQPKKPVKKEYEVIDINAIKRIVLERIRPLFDAKTVKHLSYNPVNIMDDYVFLSLFAGNDFLPRQHHMQLKFQKGHEHILDVLVAKYLKYLEDATSYLSNRGVMHLHETLNFFKILAGVEREAEDLSSDTLHLSQEGAISGLKNPVDYVRILNSHLTEEQLADLMLRDDSVSIPDQKFEQEFDTHEGQQQHHDEEPHQSDDSHHYVKPHPRELAGEKPHNKDGGIDDRHQNKSHGGGHHGHKAAEQEEEAPESRSKFLTTRLPMRTQGEYDQLIMKYLEGFQFTMMYYFRGIQHSSWNYFYPNYYAPLVTDIVDFLQRNPLFTVKFPKTEPFHPFKQLLAILPADNVSMLLPESFAKAFKNSLLPFCPNDYEIDPYGATAEHVMIVKLPFIDLQTLNRVYEEGLKGIQANEDDKRRNSFSRDTIIQYDETVEGEKLEVSNKLIWQSGSIEGAKIKKTLFSNLDEVVPVELTDLQVEKHVKQPYHNQAHVAHNPQHDEKHKE